ncbi:MAG: thiopurine S-methyltransferase [Verrucomicrobiales bacterium]|jgi:thiopurine S-methyltransferase
MEHDDWAELWSAGRIAFHQSDVNDFLTKYLQQACGDDIGRVYVPLCGKSLDMVFLAEHTDQVVGVEFVEQGVADFFDERGLTPRIDTDPQLRYTADKYSLFAADFFDLTKEHLGSIDAVFDRAALVALDAETRVRYTEHLRSITRAGARMLLITFDYDQSAMDGPPFAISPDEVERLYGDGFDIVHLETREATDETFRSRGLPTITESAYALTRHDRR